MQNHLKQFGWYPNRKINDYDDFMERYHYPEFIREFMREFGGLKVLELLEKNETKVINRTSLNPLDSDGMDEDSVAKDWSDDFGGKLYVVGLYSPENFDIAVDENGAVYFLGEYCQCLSNDLYRGIEAIIRIDVGGGIELDPKDTTSGKWYDWSGNLVDFHSYDFTYRKF
ncbi:SUKH-3 domain-containing protein [Tenacibaculum ovolyticum]|uniref:SUKH-3 domain-containing protein n=1 Tax=Tenacibaculum ovolyticum TaxID=104270 RepID=UPI0022F3D7E6|nr:SUKH-3 domain-containing protein [Tenacibaculum ovolyticum]WBX76601.1 SUKH-3 domain-containing protein [Tenacibaculum ovolyticum]